MSFERIQFGFVNGKKQDPPDEDFHITPCLTFAKEIQEKKIGIIIFHKRTAFGLGIEWGYWAVCIAIIFKETFHH